MLPMDFKLLAYLGREPSRDPRDLTLAQQIDGDRALRLLTLLCSLSCRRSVRSWLPPVACGISPCSPCGGTSCFSRRRCMKLWGQVVEVVARVISAARVGVAADVAPAAGPEAKVAGVAPAAAPEARVAVCR